MDSIIRLQVDTNKKIERGYTNFRKSLIERVTVSYLETRLETLEKQWLLFDDTHTKLVTACKWEEFEKSDYYLNDMYSQSEDLYTDYKIALKERLKSNTTSISKKTDDCAKDGNQMIQNGVKLPRIAIPKFSGHYSQWTTFRDLFLSLIHNNLSLDNVQKLHYLKSYLTGEAEQLLRHLPITSDNYSTCWDLLEHRFNNKKFITDCIFKRFFSQKSLTTESSNCLKEMFDTTNECLNALKNEGVNIEHWDIIVIYILCSKLDNESRKQWEAKICNNTNELPTLKLFLEFIEHRFRSLEFLCTKVVKSTTTKSHHVIKNVNESNPCTFCSSNSHKLGNCKEFAKEELPSRRNFVQNHGLCFNCLGANHSVISCRLPTRCRICKRKHHSLLHDTNNNQSTDNGEPKQSVDSTNVVVAATTSQDETKEKMEEIPHHPLITVTKESVKKVRQQCEIDDVKRISESLDIIEEWIKKQEHLVEASKYLTRGLLERVFLISKGSVEGTKRRVERLLTSRGMMPELCMNRTVEEFEAQWDVVNYVPLPKLHPSDQSRVMVTQFLTEKLEPFSILAYFRYCFLIGEYRINFDYTPSERFIIDLTNIHLGLLSKLNPIVIKKAEVLCTEGIGTKIKGIHILNAPPFVDKLVFLLKQALREKVANRVHVHNSYEDLHKYIPKEILPKDYGGDDQSVTKLSEQWKETLRTEEAKKIVKDTEKLISDESKRQDSKFNEEYMGMPGSFRKLTVD